MNRISLLTIALVGAACSPAEDPGRLAQTSDPVVVTVSAERHAPAAATYAAVVESERAAEIATRMSGTVQTVTVDVGSRVTAGQTLFTIDAGDVMARVAAARAQFELAERAFGRIDRLASDGAASAQELDQARAGFEAARAGLAEAEAQEAYAVVRAPFDGVVTARSVDPGNLAVPGMSLLTVVSPSALKVVANLPAHRSGDLTVGTELAVRIDGVSDVVSARISRIVPALGAGSRTFRIEAVPTGSWSGAVPGAWARLVIPDMSQEARWLPEDAIVRRGQLTGVYTVENDALRLRWVRLGRTQDDAVELLAGPSGQMTVVRNPAETLADGQPVSRAEVAVWGGPVTGVALDGPADAQPTFPTEAD